LASSDVRGRSITDAFMAGKYPTADRYVLNVSLFIFLSTFCVSSTAPGLSSFSTLLFGLSAVSACITFGGLIFRTPYLVSFSRSMGAYVTFTMGRMGMLPFMIEDWLGLCREVVLPPTS
jgi:uncharacterized membrane protein YfhO